jgi:Ca2+-binding EF-hand superfamily protein
VSTAAQSLANAFELMIEAYNNKKDSEVAEAFKQFDEDGSGAIDKEELQHLSKQLGHPLSDE